MIFELSLVIGLIMIVLYAVALYNTLVLRRNEKRNAFSQIDVQLQRRYELIPNLVTVAERYMKHEKDTLQAVIEARNSAAEAARSAAADPDAPGIIAELAQAEKRLAGSMGKLNVVVEAYPDLQADAQMLSLSEELTHTENRVGFARQAYSDAVMVYNSRREVFPSVIIARLFDFKEGEFFEIDDPVKAEPVRVDFAA